MIILIGGVGYSGKTLMAQRLLEKYKYPYLSMDHLKMGLYLADIECGFTPQSGTEHIGEKLWPILKGIIMTNIENKQNLIIEGGYLLPGRVGELLGEYFDSVISFYLGFSEPYIKKYFESEILGHRCEIEARGYDNVDTVADYILENKTQRELCKKYSAKYFEISGDYQSETEKVYLWIDGEISKKNYK